MKSIHELGVYKYEGSEDEEPAGPELIEEMKEISLLLSQGIEAYRKAILRTQKAIEDEKRPDQKQALRHEFNHYSEQITNYGKELLAVDTELAQYVTKH